jgi:predicted nicotinamide N-methyase
VTNFCYDRDAYAWSEKDLDEARSATVLLAADVVYSPELTPAVFEVLDKIMDFGSTKVTSLLRRVKECVP